MLVLLFSRAPVFAVTATPEYDALLTCALPEPTGAHFDGAGRLYKREVTGLDIQVSTTTVCMDAATPAHGVNLRVRLL